MTFFWTVVECGRAQRMLGPALEVVISDLAERFGVCILYRV